MTTAMILMFVGGYAWCKAWTRIKDFIKTPHHFYCEEKGCIFHASSSDKSVMETIKDGHMEEHRKG